MVLVHVGAYIAVIPVAENGDVVKKHVRPLESQLVEPAVFGDNVFQLIGRKIIVGLHSQNVMGGKARHMAPPENMYINLIIPCFSR
jgi:hypothetical protein